MTRAERAEKVRSGWIHSMWFLALAVGLPLVGYVGSIVRARVMRADAERADVRIEGYDPRDPIRGHYLSFRVRVERDDANTSPFDVWEACVGAPEGGVAPVYELNAPERDSCRQVLPPGFTNEPHRFYVQEDKALALEGAVRAGRATVTLVFISPQKVVAETLKIDGRPWGEVLD